MKKLTSPVRKVNAQVIGLDVHKRLIAYCILDRGGREIASGKIGGRPDALERFLAEYVGRRKSHLAFESSGHSLWVYDLLVARYGEDRVATTRAAPDLAVQVDLESSYGVGASFQCARAEVVSVEPFEPPARAT